MKKLICICISLILLIGCTASAFAITMYVNDAITGELLDTTTGQSSRTVRLSSTCDYDNAKKMYVYSTGVSATDSVSCSLFDGQITTGVVSVIPGDTARIEVYKGSTLLSEADLEYISEPGVYTVRNVDKDKTILSFTIVASTTGKIDQYQIPNIFTIRTVYFNAEKAPVSSNKVTFAEDGDYIIEYYCSRTGEQYNLNVTIDRQPPELEIIGVNEENIAKGPVSFGPLEAGSTLQVLVDGEDITNSMSNEYKTAGDYIVYYTDAAGNVSSYYFTMRIFFNASAWIYVILAVVIIGAAIGYKVFVRKKLTTR